MILVLLVSLLLVAHQWDWGFTADQLFLGILPYELLYQVLISVAAAGVWWYATRYAWPQDLEEAVVRELSPGAAERRESPATDADV